MIAHILSQSHRSSGVRPAGTPGTPTDWLSACRTVAVFFAVGAELRPQLDDRGVVPEDVALREHVRHGRSHTFADREAKERCIRRYRTSGRQVGDARDGVDHWLAVSVDGDLQTPLCTG